MKTTTMLVAERRDCDAIGCDGWGGHEWSNGSAFGFNECRICKGHGFRWTVDGGAERCGERGDLFVTDDEDKAVWKRASAGRWTLRLISNHCRSDFAIYDPYLAVDLGAKQRGAR